MTRTVIFTIATLTGLLLVPVGAQNVFGPENPLSSATLLQNPTIDAKAIPDWVGTTMGFYVDKQISEREMLDAFNYLFNNNILHLSEEAAQQVAELREENKQLRAGIQRELTEYDDFGLVDSFDQTLEDKSTGQVKVKFPWDRASSCILDFTREPGREALILALDPTDLEDFELQEYEKREYCVQYRETDFDFVSRLMEQEGMYYYFQHDSKTTGKAGEEIYLDEYGRITSGYNIKGQITSTTEISEASKIISQLLDKGETSEASWKKFAKNFRYADAGSDSSTVDELNGIVAFCNIAMDKEIHALQAEVMLLEGLSGEHIGYRLERATDDTSTKYAGEPTEDKITELLSKHLVSAQQKIESSLAGIAVCEIEMRTMEKQYQTASDMTQMMQMELQDAMNKQSQAIQTLSAILKSQHDTVKAIIQNMRA